MKDQLNYILFLFGLSKPMGTHAITRPFGLTDPTPFEAATSACANHVHAATCIDMKLI